jgi:hypothetical protein
MERSEDQKRDEEGPQRDGIVTAGSDELGIPPKAIDKADGEKGDPSGQDDFPENRESPQPDPTIAHPSATGDATGGFEEVTVAKEIQKGDRRNHRKDGDHRSNANESIEAAPAFRGESGEARGLSVRRREVRDHGKRQGGRGRHSHAKTRSGGIPLHRLNCIAETARVSEYPVHPSRPHRR